MVRLTGRHVDRRTAPARAARGGGLHTGRPAAPGHHPGLTRIWQVSGRGDILAPQQVQLDADYIEEPELLARHQVDPGYEIPAVLLGKGAYCEP